MVNSGEKGGSGSSWVNRCPLCARDLCGWPIGTIHDSSFMISWQQYCQPFGSATQGQLKEVKQPELLEIIWGDTEGFESLLSDFKVCALSCRELCTCNCLWGYILERGDLVFLVQSGRERQGTMENSYNVVLGHSLFMILKGGSSSFILKQSLQQSWDHCCPPTFQAWSKCSGSLCWVICCWVPQVTYLPGRYQSTDSVGDLLSLSLGNDVLGSTAEVLTSPSL